MSDWQNIERFTPKVIERLGHYVYLYLDPRTGEPFYVGKGKGNRCFAHLKDTSMTRKAERIAELKKLGLRPRIEILKHGLTAEEAFLVESTAIDLIGVQHLTNEVTGHGGAGDRSKAGVAEVQAELSATPVTIRDPVILITINKLYRPDLSLPDIYDATRSAWKINPTRHKPKYALSVYRGIVRAAFAITAWHEAGTTLQVLERDGKQAHGPRSGRWEFVGTRADDKVWRRYVGKSVREYAKPGAQNPILFVNC